MDRVESREPPGDLPVRLSGVPACAPDEGFEACAESIPNGFAAVLADLPDEEAELELADALGGELIPISSAIGQHPVRPSALRAFVGLGLLAPVPLDLFFSAESLDHLADCLGSLGRALPIPHLSVPLRTRADDDLSLLAQSLFEACQKCLVISSHHRVHAGLRAPLEFSYVACPVGFELGELRFAFVEARFARCQRFSAASFVIVDDPLDHI